MTGGERALSFVDHDRDSAGLRYVYPVVSRRAGGVSVGINLNPNNACNWRCVYCQVPGLQRGAAPAIDLELLSRELAGFIERGALERYMRRFVPEGLRALRDIAFSGNGEPTTARGFEQIVRRVGELRERAGHGNEVPLRLITNGTLVSRDGVARGLVALAGFGGEAWFKVDAVEPDRVARINGAARSRERTIRDLAACASRCPTWIQTCLFAWDGRGPDERLLEELGGLFQAAAGLGVKGVLLYGVARPSMQAERTRIGRLDEASLRAIARRLEESGLTVEVSP